MKKRWQLPIIFAIVILSLFGVVTTLYKNPFDILRMVITSAIVIGLIILIYRLFIRKKLGSEMDAYRRAARKSARRYKNNTTKTSTHLKVIRTRALNKHRLLKTHHHRNAEHLKVIEGKKRKKKNRVLF